MVKITCNAREQIETAFIGFLKGLSTNTGDDVTKFEHLNLSCSRNQMLLVAAEISVFASYNQTPAPYYHLAKNCDRKSGMAPKYSKGNSCRGR